MARIDNLNHFLTDVAFAIKEKTGMTVITPANFDTAINNISTGVTPNGTLKNYYVAANSTVNAGDFVEVVQGISSLATGASTLATIYDGEPGGGNRTREGGIQAYKLDDTHMLFAYHVYIEDGLFAVIGELKYGNILLGEPMLIASTSSGEPHYMKLLGNGDLVLCHGTGHMVFLHYEGNQLFYINNYTIEDEGTVKMVYSENPDGTLNALGGRTFTYTATGITKTNVPSLETSISFTKDSYGTYEPESVMSYTMGGDSDYESKNTAANPMCFAVANQYCLVINQLSSSAIEEGSKVGTTGIYARMMDASSQDRDCGWDLMTLWTGSGYNKVRYFIYPGASYGWMLVREDTTTGSEADGDDYYTLKAYKLTFSGTVVSRASSPVTVSSSLREAFMYYEVMPISSTQALFEHYSYYSPYPINCAVLTASSSTVSMGAMTTISFNSERVEGELDHITPLTSSSFVLNTCGYTNERYYAKPLYYSGSVITEQTKVANYEEQVRPATTLQCAGLAQTQGTGGNDTAHNQQVSIYVPTV